MKKILLLCLLFTALVPAYATHYFIAPAGGGGNDSNNGLSSGAPFLSPNHAFNCGDDISAASGTYSATNFGTSKWGTVTCAANNNVVMINCAVFDTCKIAASNVFAMWITTSYWGVQGFEVSGTGNGGVCFGVGPTGGSTIHHFVLANNVANGCANGFSFFSGSSTASFDYGVVISNIAWNASQSTAFCNSGITFYEPIKSDSSPGTHNYIAGNFAFDNTTPTNCSTGTSTFDGNGVVLDDIGNAQSGGAAYDQQIAVVGNLAVFNGGNGIGSTGNGSANSHIFFRNNTSVKNQQATNDNTTTCGDVMVIGPQALTELYGNLVVTKGSTSCQSSTQPLYAIAMYNGNATNHFYNNWLYSAAGNNVGLFTNNGFASGPNNTTGTDPLLVNPVDPGQPNCTGTSSVVNCMASVIANYTPLTTAAIPFGYQLPQTTSSQSYDPLFPQWLCNVSLPSGLITMHCVTPSNYRADVGNALSNALVALK